MGRVFVVKAFGRWATKEGVDDDTLLQAIADADKGIIAADHGDNVVKLRIAREGGGKSGGSRAVVALKKDDKAFYLHGWNKNEYENINKSFLGDLKKAAKIWLNLDEAGIQKTIDSGNLREILKPDLAVIVEPSEESSDTVEAANKAAE